MKMKMDSFVSTPAYLILFLSNKYSDLSFEVFYADEDLGNNCGRYIFENGNEIEYESYGIKEACEIWDYDLSEVAPDIYRDEQIDKIIDEED